MFFKINDHIYYTMMREKMNPLTACTELGVSPTGYNNDYGKTVNDETDWLWDVDPPDRFVKLALRYPELLNYTDQIKWKLIRENGFLWKGHTNSGVWTWQVREESLIFERLRQYWKEF